MCRKVVFLWAAAPELDVSMLQNVKRATLWEVARFLAATRSSGGMAAFPVARTF